MHPKTRDRFLAVLALAVSLAGTGAIAANYGSKQAPEVQSIDLWAGDLPENRWSVQFVGDTMLGNGETPMLDPLGFDAAMAGVAPLIDGNFVIANAEAPITTHNDPLIPGKAFVYKAEPQAAWAMSKAGIDAINLGNNHSLDMGVTGLEDTIQAANNAVMATFGAGHNLSEAERPLLLHTDRGTIGVVSIGENFGKVSKASDINPGTVVFSPETVQRGYDLAREAGADWVVGFVHWGDNYTETLPQQRYWAQVLVDAGYDAIVGSGSHVAEKIEFIGHVPVVFGLGNFVFGTPGRYASFGKQGVGLMVSFELNENAPTQLVVKCIVTDNQLTGFLTQPCSAPQALGVLSGVNPALQIQGNVARMPCRCLEPPK
ncbi:CapA family protein [Pseudarthrobacter sp. B4EP4b]|uniref:CapA family protein n=1 Tax=Pseudarthrobacter sp. B4EP4b TaxID=2590664 RepID=UPI0011505400|nr:CapA family protein [Pseudarthrobacter sp. B4EP4b]